MVKTLEDRKGRRWLLVSTSLMVGLTFLVDISNCVLYGAFVLTLWAWTKQSLANSTKKISMVLGAVLVSLSAPVIWMLRNYLVIDDVTGSRAKTAQLTWTVKPLGEILHHPIFSLGGVSYFLGNLVRAFWRGEYEWHGFTMSWPPADWLYLLSTLVAVTAFAVHVFSNWKKSPLNQRVVECQSLLLVFGSVLFMAAISLPYDFQNCPNPSREHPFFVSGRIISGALLPFALIYTAGIESLLRPIRKWIPPAAVLGCLLVFVTIVEFQVRRVAFSSPHNFFALRKWQQGHELPDGYLISQTTPLSLDETSRRDQEGVNDFRELAQQNPHLYAPYLATALDNLASADCLQNRWEEALGNYHDSLKIYRRLAEEDPAKYLPEVVMVLNDLGRVEGLRMRLDDARQHFEEALKIAEQLAQQSPEAYLPDLAGALSNLGLLNRIEKRTDESRGYYAHALNIYRSLAQRDPARYASDVGRIEAALAELTRKAPPR